MGLPRDSCKVRRCSGRSAPVCLVTFFELHLTPVVSVSRATNTSMAYNKELLERFEILICSRSGL